jgi:plastocyanin
LVGLSGGSAVSDHSLPLPAGRATHTGAPDVEDVLPPVADVLAPVADEGAGPDEPVAEEPPAEEGGAEDVDEPGGADVDEGGLLEDRTTDVADPLVDPAPPDVEDPPVAEEACARDVTEEVAGVLLAAVADEEGSGPEDAREWDDVPADVAPDDDGNIEELAGRPDEVSTETAAPLLDAVVTGSPPGWQYPSRHAEPRGQSPSELHGWTQELPWRSCPSAHLTQAARCSVPVAATSARTRRFAGLFMNATLRTRCRPPQAGGPQTQPARFIRPREHGLHVTANVPAAPHFWTEQLMRLGMRCGVLALALFTACTGSESGSSSSSSSSSSGAVSGSSSAQVASSHGSSLGASSHAASGNSSQSNPPSSLASGSSGGSAMASSAGMSGSTGATSAAVSSSSSAQQNSSSAAPSCVDPAVDCPAPASECVLAVCTNGACAEENVAMETALAVQVPGDCLLRVCDGAGAITSKSAVLDVLNDNNDCTDDVCLNDMPMNIPSSAGASCAQTGGAYCDGSGHCVECLGGADCPSGVCTGFVCSAATCLDMLKNGAETAVDCGGGTCGGCAAGLACNANGDCASNACLGGACAATCTDGVKDGAETDIDCGGGTCALCTPGHACNISADCSSLACSSNLCVPASCMDAVKNGTETDLDCGGGTCPACVAGKLCAVGADCSSRVCSAGLCQVASCTDGVKNGSETDVDCGGACSSKCGATKACNVGSDCTTGICQGNVCSLINNCDPSTAMDMSGTANVMVSFGVSGLTYTPSCLKVRVGDQVTFNGNFAFHPLQGGEVRGGTEFPAASGPFVPVTNTGAAKTFIMSSTGTFPYYCVPHGPIGMNGVVFVVP